MIYAIRIEKLSDGTFVTTCRDIPECTYVSEDFETAYYRSSEAIPFCLELRYRQQKKAMPLPTPVQEGEMKVYVPIRVQARILLWNTIIEKGLNMTKFAKAIGVSNSQAQRLVDFTKKASPESIEIALSKLGYLFDVSRTKE